MYITLNIYTDILQPLITDATTIYYTKKAANPQELPKYLMQIENDLKSEEDRAASYLHPATSREMVSIVEQECIFNRIAWCVSKQQLEPLLIGNKYEDLSRLYRLLARVNGTASLRTPIETFVKVNHRNYSGGCFV